MSLSKFENSVVDQFMVNLSKSGNATKRNQTYNKVKNILKDILDDSVLITAYGSGPLKTHLPESDIDITILFTDYLIRHK